MNVKEKRFTAWMLVFCMTVTALVWQGKGLVAKAENEETTENAEKTVLYAAVKAEDFMQRQKGEDGYYLCPENVPEGYVFAGWYLGQDESQPLGKDVTEVNETVYAKYVPAEVMNVKAQLSTNLLDCDSNNDGEGAIRFVSTIDSGRYQEVGFDFTIEGVSYTGRQPIKTVYKSLYCVDYGQDGNSGELVVSKAEPKEVGCGSSEYFMAWGFRGVPANAFGEAIEATPYWITLDGTIVYGKAVEKTVNQGVFGTTWGAASGMSYNAQEDQYISSGCSYLYSKPAVGNVGVSATLKKPAEGNSNAGITVRVGDVSKQFMANDNELVFTNDYNDCVTSVIMPGNFYDKNGEARVKGLVKDGYFYLFFDDEEMLCRDMTELFKDESYNKDSSDVEIGFSSFWSIVGFKNMKYLSSDEIDAVVTTQDVLPKAANFNHANADKTEYGMEGIAYLYGKKVTGNVGVSSTLRRSDAGDSNAGITVRVGNKSKEFMLNAKNELVYCSNNGTFGSASPMAGYNFYNENGMASVKGLVKDGFFYLFSGEDEILCKSMTELFTDYNQDSSQVEIGLCGWNSSGIIFSEVMYLSPDEVAKVETTEYVNFQYNKITDEYTMKDASAYLYGKKATGNVGVSATLVEVPGGINTNAGITVRVGGQSKQFMLNAGNELVKGTNSVTLDGAERKEEYTFYENGMASVKGLVKDGYFYLLSGEEEILCKSMTELFPGYSQGSSQVEIGLCGWHSTGVKFCEVTYLSPDEVANALPKSANFNYNESANEYTMKDASAYRYGEKATGNVGVSATLVEVPGGINTNAGITVRVGGQSKQFMLNNGNELVKGTNSVGLDGAEHKEGYTFYENGMASVKGLVKDGYFYLLSGEEEILCKSMTELFPDYSQGSSQVEIGLCGWHSTGVKFCDVTYLSPDEVANALPKSANFNYDESANEYTMKSYEAPAYLYGKKATGNVSVSATLEEVQGVNTNAGITVRVGGQSKQFMLNKGNELVKGTNSVGLDGADHMEGYTFYADGKASVKGLVKDGYFYLLSGEKEILCRSMTELFPGYSQGSSQVEIGLCGWCSTGVKFTNVEYLFAGDVK